MKLYLPLFSFFILVSVSSCVLKGPDYNEIIEVINEFSVLQAILDSEQDQTLVVNFWATTCPPCLKEMPHFNELEKEQGAKGIKIYLVSLDRVKDLDKRVYPFVEKHALLPEVMLLGDQNYSAWTDDIDPSWFGALPATLIKKGERRKFKFGAYESYEELRDDVSEVSGK